VVELDSLAAVAAAIRAGKISPVEVTRHCLDRIARLDGRLRAFITLDADGALAASKGLEAEAARGQWRGPLHGVPLAFKDLCAIGGLPTSCGTATRDYFTAEADCTAVRRLLDAGGVNLGKLNMTELAMGALGDNPHHGHARNPWNPEYCTGGSSSGSGVAIAAGLAVGAIGTDTGGSIRLPAAFCGITGLKPTYGRVSRAGAMALSWSNDHIGPMARTAADCALMLQAMAGVDPLDTTASARPVDDYVAALDGPVRGLRIGVAEALFGHGLAPEMETAVRAAAAVFGTLGARVESVRLPDLQAVADVTGLISRSEGSTLHGGLLRDRPESLGAFTRARLELGLGVPAFDYLQALRLRARLARTFIREVWGEVDALVAPVIAEPAPPLTFAIEGDVQTIVERQGRLSRLTRPFNGLGMPALSLPCGFSTAGLPLAFQLVGRPFDEATVLRLGHAYQRATDWHRRMPALAG
jgi:aspartyl-tRNA(Asn)/glutamyl-tRNA(Gln) amidotransferase subunit A